MERRTRVWLRPTAALWALDETLCPTACLLAVPQPNQTEDPITAGNQRQAVTEIGDFFGALVEAGTYASASEVVRAGPRALQERDAAVERWLRE